MVRPVVAWVVLGVAGCEQTYLPCAGGNEEADAVVDASGDVPVFDWEFGTAYALSVYELDGDETGRTMWHVQCGGDNLEDAGSLEAQICIETPIAYGEEVHDPDRDRVNSVRAASLEPGARYQLWLNTMTEDDGPPQETVLPDWMESDRDDPHCGSGFSAKVDFVAGEGGIFESE
jgi:hypothetical protein